ncbi:ABC1 family protein [gamma proteobacterium HdN1]|nr:ABC1 family protein [gamma proteobacterium HdN1]
MIGDIFDTVGSLLEGGERYVAATRTGFDIEQIYRRYRHEADDHSVEESRELLDAAHQKGASLLTRLFHENGAIWVKFGQFLSSRTDILPPQYVQELQKLQNDAKPAEFRKIQKVLEAEWGADWRSRFAAFDETPVAAASVAQVHRATLTTGERVAVKIQLPQARRLFRQDSAVFKALARVGAPMVSHFDLRQVIDQIVDITLQELDFLHEESNLRKFENLPHSPRIYVPKLFGEMSSERVLVTEWIDGVRLTDYLNQHPEQAERILREMLHSYIQQITAFGVFHADPHPGNFLVMNNGRVAVLDYGAIGVLTQEEAQNYAILLQVLFGRITLDTPLGELFRKAGFVAKDQRVFEEVADLVLKEALRNPTSSDILALALDRMRSLKVQIPDSFVSLARVVLTFGGLLKTYQIKVSGLDDAAIGDAQAIA